MSFAYTLGAMRRRLVPGGGHMSHIYMSKDDITRARLKPQPNAKAVRENGVTSYLSAYVVIGRNDAFARYVISGRGVVAETEWDWFVAANWTKEELGITAKQHEAMARRA